MGSLLFWGYFPGVSQVYSERMDANSDDSLSTILLVDDSPTDRAACRRFLTQGNDLAYKIIEAESGEESLMLLEQDGIDLVLLDYNLPDTDGLSLLARIKQHLSTDMPVIVLTGQGDERIAAQAIKLGAQEYIVKQQLMADVLRLAVRTAIRESRLQARLEAYQAQQSLIQDIALRVRQSLNLQDILAQAALEVRGLLECDRVILYRFLPDNRGVVEVESVSPKWPAIQGEVIDDDCFENGWLKTYLSGKTTAIENIHQQNLNSCYRDMLVRYQVQANLVVPIALAKRTFHPESPLETEEKTLWGLLIAHQCQAPRHWQKSEVQLLRQISDHLAIALQQSILYQQLETTNQRLEELVASRTAELQQANEDLRHLNQALKTSNQDLEQFAYIASHDLREPLRKIKSFAELLAKRYRGQIDEKGDRYIDYITGGAMRMQTLINDLLAYSRLGRRELLRADTDLNHVLMQVLDTLSEQILQQQAVVCAQPLPTLPVDALQIEQLLTNLVENALKYRGEAEPEIAVTAELKTPEPSAGEQTRDEWMFYVKDNGIGIDAEFYERIFTIFQRLHSKSEYSGTGIGLAICQKIVARHGGRMGVTSVVGDGSTFWFTLPAN